MPRRQRRSRRRRRRKMSQKQFERYLNFLAKKKYTRRMKRSIRRGDIFRPRQRTYAAPTGTTRARFTSVPIENNGLKVSGYDMVYDMTQAEIDESSGTFVAIPANPAYWTGTRIAQLAVAYSQYRPIYMRFDYFPSVSMQDRGTVTSGTVWKQAPTTGSISQALTTSNAGRTHTVWTRSRSRIKVGSNLDQNLYDMNGTFDDDSNPFIFLAVVNDAENQRIPGYYMCQYTFELKNPIGDGNEYEHEIKAAGDVTVDDVWENTSAVLRSEAEAFGPGTVLTIQVIEGVVQFLLNGSRLGVAANLIFDLFKNRNKNVQTYNSNELLLKMFVSGVSPGPSYPYYNLQNPGKNIIRDMFVQYIPEQNARLYGWGFTMTRNSITPKYFWNHTLEDNDFDDPTDRTTFKWMCLEGYSTQDVFVKSLLNSNNSGAPSYYQSYAPTSYFVAEKNGDTMDILIQDGVTIDNVLEAVPDAGLVGTGSIVMH